MLRLCFFIIIFCINHYVLAAEDFAPKNVVINLKVNCQFQNQVTSTQNRIKLKTNHQWIVINSLQQKSPSSLSHPNFFILLGKVLQADSKKVTFNFLLLDSTSHFIIEPKITVNYNQKGEINLHQENHTIKFVIFATTH